jgi:hypothetical protein
VAEGAGEEQREAVWAGAPKGGTQRERQAQQRRRLGGGLVPAGHGAGCGWGGWGGGRVSCDVCHSVCGCVGGWVGGPMGGSGRPGCGRYRATKQGDAHDTSAPAKNGAGHVPEAGRLKTARAKLSILRPHRQRKLGYSAFLSSLPSPLRTRPPVAKAVSRSEGAPSPPSPPPPGLPPASVSAASSESPDSSPGSACRPAPTACCCCCCWGGTGGSGCTASSRHDTACVMPGGSSGSCSCTCGSTARTVLQRGGATGLREA